MIIGPMQGRPVPQGCHFVPEAAAAEIERLRAALQEIYEMMNDDRCGDVGDIREIASAALCTQDDVTDSN